MKTTAIKMGKTPTNQKFTIENCNFTGVQFDKSHAQLLLDMVRTYQATVEGLNRIGHLLTASDINIENLFSINAGDIKNEVKK